MRKSLVALALSAMLLTGCGTTRFGQVLSCIDGTPIAGAKVQRIPDRGWGVPKPPAVLTDKAGRFRVRLHPRVARLQISRDGYHDEEVWGKIDDDRSHRAVILLLPKGVDKQKARLFIDNAAILASPWYRGERRGRVVSAKGGRPLAGAKVEPLYLYLVNVPGAVQVPSVITDARGAFRVQVNGHVGGLRITARDHHTAVAYIAGHYDNPREAIITLQTDKEKRKDRPLRPWHRQMLR